ncbi:MAG: sugar phosphate isomerase/epimerase [Fuerstiella sp.]
MHPFKFSLNSSTIKTSGILDKIKAAGDAGYDGIELWHDDIDAFVAAGGKVKDVCSALGDSGLAVPTTIHMKDWFQPAGSVHAAAMDVAKRKLEQAAAVGAKFTVAGPPRGAADRQLGKRHYHELLNLGQQFGVRPAFEYLGFVEDIKTIDDAIEIAEGSGHPDACIVLDPFHCHVGEGGFEAISKLTADQIAISHFNDALAIPAAAAQRDPDRVMPGDGAIDLHAYLRAIVATGYSGYLSLELFRPELWEQDPAEVAVVGLKKMESVVEKAMVKS